MKKEIDSQTFNSIQMNLNKILLLNYNRRLYCITEFEMITEKKEIIKPKTWFRNSSVEIVTITYMTKLTIQTIHSQGKFLGVLTDSAAEDFIDSYNLYKLREDWQNIYEQIKLFGGEITYGNK